MDKVNSRWAKTQRGLLVGLSLTLSLFFLSGCIGIINIGDTTNSFSGFWEGMPAYDRDPTDADESEKPEYIFYLRINQVGTRVFGQLSRVTSSGFLEGSLSGQRKEATIEFVAKFKDESITFTGSWLNDRRGWVGKWVSDQGDSGEAIFLSKTVDLNQIKGIFGNKNELIFKGGNGQPVIFVHGIMSDGSRWDKSLEQLQAHNYFEDHQVWVFQYNWRDPIVLNGEDFLKRLNEAGIHDPVIVAHSMGGLVSRSCIAQGGEIERLITLGTPHNGTPLANFGALLLGSSNFGEWVQNVLFPGLSDMKETSSFIADLNSNQRDIQQREKYVVFSGGMSCYIVARNVCLENGCDQRAVWAWMRSDYDDALAKMCFRMIPGKNDGYVPESSALFENGGIAEKNQNKLPGYLEHTQITDPDKSPDFFSYLLLQD